MKQKNEETWESLENHKAPCNIMLLCDYKKTYTGPGKEYTSLWNINNEGVHITLEEIKRGKGNVLWGRLKNGMGWIDLTDVQHCD